MLRSLPLMLICLALAEESMAEDKSGPAFYVPPMCSTRLSSRASIRSGSRLHKTVRRDDRGHLVSISSFVDPNGEVMGWHDFGYLEGPGWAANAVGGAYEIHCLGTFLGRTEWQQKALSILDHVLEGRLH